MADICRARKSTSDPACAEKIFVRYADHFINGSGVEKQVPRLAAATAPKKARLTSFAALPRDDTLTAKPALRRVARFRFLRLGGRAGRALELALRWFLVEAQSLKYWRAHLCPGPAALSFVCPLGEFDFGDQFWLHKMDRPRAFHLAEERTALGFQRVQAFPQRRVRFLSEAAAGVADMNQPALVIVKAQHNGPEVFA